MAAGEIIVEKAIQRPRGLFDVIKCSIQNLTQEGDNLVIDGGWCQELIGIDMIEGKICNGERTEAGLERGREEFFDEFRVVRRWKFFEGADELQSFKLALSE